MNDEFLPMNPVYFRKMAHGDLDGFRELAFDFFNDTRRLMPGWLTLIEAGEFDQLREELHRCKGGASLFGLERIVRLIGSSESPMVLETKGFDLATFDRELSEAETAVIALAESAA